MDKTYSENGRVVNMVESQYYVRREGEKGAMTTTESTSVSSAEWQYHLLLRGFWGVLRTEVKGYADQTCRLKKIRN
jgi:hypothetical protein